MPASGRDKKEPACDMSFFGLHGRRRKTRYLTGKKSERRGKCRSGESYGSLRTRWMRLGPLESTGLNGAEQKQADRAKTGYQCGEKKIVTCNRKMKDKSR